VTLALDGYQPVNPFPRNENSVVESLKDIHAQEVIFGRRPLIGGLSSAVGSGRSGSVVLPSGPP
jgi:hypothetical protein